MIPNLILNSLECALQAKKCKHYITNDPITMPCGHTACKSCIVKLSKQQSIVKCLFCEQYNEVDVQRFGESYIVKRVVENYLQDLFSVIYNEMKNTFHNLKDTMNTFDKRLDEHIDYLQDEIELRIALVRLELDELSQAFKDELSDFKIKVKNKKEFHEDTLKEYQNKIEDLNKLIDDLNFKDDIITFNESSSIIDKSFIGTLNLNYCPSSNKSNKNLIESLRTIQSTEKQLSYKFIGFSPNSLITINNESTLVLVYNDKFELFDSELNLTKTIRGGGEHGLGKMNCCRAVTNRKDKIYLCEYNSHKLRLLDYGFNELVLAGRAAKKRHQFYYPYDLAYKSGYLYVCDLRNRIVKMNESTFEHVFEYKVNFQIRQMLITPDSECLCVNTFNFDKIYFINLSNFEVLNVCEESSGGPLCELDSYVYEFNSSSKCITYFDSTGNLIEKYKTKSNLKNFTFNNSVCMIRFSSKIILSSSCGKLLSI